MFADRMNNIADKFNELHDKYLEEGFEFSESDQNLPMNKLMQKIQATLNTSANK